MAVSEKGSAQGTARCCVGGGQHLVMRSPMLLRLPVELQHVEEWPKASPCLPPRRHPSAAAAARRPQNTCKRCKRQTRIAYPSATAFPLASSHLFPRECMRVRTGECLSKTSSWTTSWRVLKRSSAASRAAQLHEHNNKYTTRRTRAILEALNECACDAFIQRSSNDARNGNMCGIYACMPGRTGGSVGPPAGSPHSHLLNTTTPAVSLRRAVQLSNPCVVEREECTHQTPRKTSRHRYELSRSRRLRRLWPTRSAS